MIPTRDQVAEVIHDALLGKRAMPMEYTKRIEDAIDAVMAVLADVQPEAQQPRVLTGDVSLYLEDGNGTVYLASFAGCATADGRLLPHPHTPQPGCNDVYRIIIEAPPVHGDTETPESSDG